MTRVERNFGHAVARAYAGHTDSGSEAGATSTYVRASLAEVAAALAALTGELVPAEQRLAEIHHRYGPGHLVSRSIQRATPMILRAVEQVHHRAARTTELCGPEAAKYSHDLKLTWPRNAPRPVQRIRINFPDLKSCYGIEP